MVVSKVAFLGFGGLKSPKGRFRREQRELPNAVDLSLLHSVIFVLLSSSQSQTKSGAIPMGEGHSQRRF